MSPPLSAALSFSSPSYVTHEYTIPKTAGLGVIIGGGEGKPDGPHIIIDKILDGMDAAMVRPSFVGKLLFGSLRRCPLLTIQSVLLLHVIMPPTNAI